MKKTLNLIITIALTALLCACNSNPFEDVGSSLVDSDAKVSQSTQKDSQEDAKKDEEKDDSTQDQTGDFEKGKCNGTVYESKFLGLGCDLGEGWAFFGDENIAELNASSQKAIYDMIALGPSGSENANVMFEKKSSEEIENLNLVKNFMQSAEEIKSSAEGMGATNWKYEVVSVKIDGEIFDAAQYSFNLNGSPICQVIFAKKCDDYLATVTVSADSKENVQKTLDKFYIVK